VKEYGVKTQPDGVEKLGINGNRAGSRQQVKPLTDKPPKGRELFVVGVFGDKLIIHGKSLDKLPRPDKFIGDVEEDGRAVVFKKVELHNGA